jgi:hypothetical protein
MTQSGRPIQQRPAGWTRWALRQLNPTAEMAPNPTTTAVVPTSHSQSRSRLVYGARKMRFLSMRNRYLSGSVLPWPLTMEHLHDCLAAGVESPTDYDGALAHGMRRGTERTLENSDGEDEKNGEEVEEHDEDVGEGEAVAVVADADATHTAGCMINDCRLKGGDEEWSAPAMADKRQVQSMKMVVQRERVYVGSPRGSEARPRRSLCVGFVGLIADIEERPHVQLLVMWGGE